MREKSNILVIVPNLQKVLDAIRETTGKNYKYVDITYEGVGPAGFIRAKPGWYALSREGVSLHALSGVDPIMNDNHVEIPLVNDSGKSITFDDRAICLNLDQIEALMADEEGEFEYTTLDKFIREFGHRLETNYLAWAKAMEEAKAETTEVKWPPKN